MSDIEQRYQRAIELQAELNAMTQQIWLELREDPDGALAAHRNLAQVVAAKYHDNQLTEPPGLIPVLQVFELDRIRGR